MLFTQQHPPCKEHRLNETLKYKKLKLNLQVIL